MKRRVLSFVAMASAVMAVLVITDTFSQLPGGVARASAANVVQDFACTILLPGGGTIEADESHVVETSSGNVQFKCQGTIPEGSEPENTERVEGNECITPFGITFDTVNQYNPGGQATLTCTIKASASAPAGKK